jgi:PAS domain S-box-containing protein
MDGAGPEPAGRQRGEGWLPGTAERYRALSEQVPAVLYSEVHTPDGAIVYKSPQNQQLFGYTAEESQRPDFWHTLIHPDDRERVLAENERCDRSGAPWHMEYRALAKDGRVVWVRDHAVPVVAWVDSAKVERVVENLLANAGRHTTPDTPVWVKLARRDGGVLLAVEDAGGGVPRELRATLFEPFRREPGAAAHAPGVGIGLSLVARFAELHGGRAWVQDRPGGGASFRVLLPDAAEPADVGGRA